MSAKDLRYAIHHASCTHWDDGTHRGKWRATVQLFAVDQKTGEKVRANGEGQASAPSVAMKEAVQDAFSEGGRQRRETRSTRGRTR